MHKFCFYSIIKFVCLTRKSMRYKICFGECAGVSATNAICERGEINVRETQRRKTYRKASIFRSSGRIGVLCKRCRVPCFAAHFEKFDRNASQNVAEKPEAASLDKTRFFRKIEKMRLYDRSFVFAFREHLFLPLADSVGGTDTSALAKTNFVSHRFSRQTNEFNYRIKTKFMHDRSDCGSKTARTLDPDAKGHVAEGFCNSDDRPLGLQTKTRT